MEHAPISRVKRRPVNLSLSSALVAQGRELGINISRACENGLNAEIKRERERRWVEENWEAIQSSNAWVEQHGLPYEKYRMF